MRNVKRGFVGLGVARSRRGQPGHRRLPPVAQSPAAGGLKVGVSWNNFNEPRWAAVRRARHQGSARGRRRASTSRRTPRPLLSSSSRTSSNLISQGADALIILAQDGTAILPAVQSAVDQGIPVIAYDRLIENPGTLYLTFDNKGVGKIMAETIFPLVPKGNYAIIKGNQADANADFLRAGMEEVIGAGGRLG